MRSGMNPEQKKAVAELAELKLRALNDLFFFSRNVLGYHKMVEHVHVPLCRFLHKEIPRGPGEQTTKLILMPRGSFKSTVGTISYALWRLCKNPEITILITNENLDKSKAFLKEIKGHITNNKRFRALFGDLSCEKRLGRKWSEDRIDISLRQHLGTAPNIEASSVTSSETGKHVDLIICDDLVGYSNFGTPDQLAKVDAYVRDLGAVLKPGGGVIFIGTRWDFRDTYNTQLDFIKQMGDLARADVYIRKAISDDGLLLFPEELSAQFLKAQRLKLGPYFFSCQYLNEPVNRENALIQRIEKYGDMINGLPAEEYFRESCVHFMTVDIAYTDTARSDSTAIFIAAVDKQSGKRYVRDYRVFKTTDPEKVIQTIFEMHDRFRPVRVGIESNQYKSWLRIPLEEAMRRTGRYMNVDPPEGLKHYGKSQAKHLRLAKLAPVYNLGDYLLAEWMTDLEDQLRLLTYDGVRGKDDLLDAHAMQEEIIYYGHSQPLNTFENEKPKGLTWGELKRRAVEMEAESTSNAWLYN